MIQAGSTQILAVWNTEVINSQWLIHSFNFSIICQSVEKSCLFVLLFKVLDLSEAPSFVYTGHRYVL